MHPLPRGFYLREATEVAPALLGKLLVRRTGAGVSAGVIVETEAYIGSRDKGAHSYPNKRTERTEVQFGPGGYAYVYTIYGMHTCFNVVVNVPQEPEVVLVRALRPVEGLELMAKRRGTTDPAELCSGPAKLCQAMDITRAQYGCDLLGGELYIRDFEPVPPQEILVSPRINIDYAQECRDYPWRYFIKGEPWVSKVAPRYRQAGRPWTP